MLNASTCFKLIEGDKKYTHHNTKDVVLQWPRHRQSTLRIAYVVRNKYKELIVSYFIIISLLLLLF